MGIKVHTSEESRKNGAKGGASPKRKATLDAKRLIKTFLLSSPTLSPAKRRELEAMGLDLNDPDMTDNAAVITAVLIKKAQDGDLKAIQMAMEMAGQAIDAKTALEIKRIELERERIGLERERLELQKSQVAPVFEESEDPFIGALSAYAQAAGFETDLPEDVTPPDDVVIDNNGGDSK